MPKTLLRDLSAAAIVTSIADAAERWADADFPARVRVTKAIENRLGYSTPVVEYALDRIFFSLRRDRLEAAIVDELGSLAALDRPVSRPGWPDAFARGVERVTIISSDATIGVALVPALYALCAKCDITVKDRSDALIAAFFETLRHERPEFAAAAHARTWTGGNDADEAAILAASDVVVAFGADATLRAIRERIRPDARFVAFGHRISIGFIAAGALTSPTSRAAILEDAARDALLYDGEGCLSLHALFVETNPEDRTLIEELGAAMERASLEFPAGTLDAQRAASVASYRNLAAFRAAGGRGAMFSIAAGSGTIVFDPPHDQPPPLLPRVLPVYPIASIAEAAAFVRRHKLPVQAIGVADTSAASALQLAQDIGAVRLAPLGSMQAPPPDGHHGGSQRIADYVRWIDVE
ncbi:MAG: hypothetical protein NVSMB5_03370 [Candidatus Velthaea sp.]